MEPSWVRHLGKHKNSLKRLGEKHTNVLKIRENITIISILKNIKIFENYGKRKNNINFGVKTTIFSPIGKNWVKHNNILKIGKYHDILQISEYIRIF